MKAKFAIPLTLIAGLTLAAGNASASDEAFGALLGGATGAVIGHAIGGRDAAVAGGAFGAIVGAAAASEQDRYYDDYYGPRRVYGPPPPVYYGPPRVVYQEFRPVYGPPPVIIDYAPARYGYYGYHGGWRHNDGRWDRDRDGRWHRGW
ncbi:MAG TPA: glycine zipper 2TM domain-containing protein [Thiobacillaceae bacterium]|nr:glycine zipper 2TM domain-containing protein [Thiobacillaceae bacterium]